MSCSAAEHAVDQLLAAFTAVDRPVRFAFAPSAKTIRVAIRNFVEREAFEYAEIALPQPGLRHDRDTQPRRQRFGREPGPRQFARVNGVDRLSAEPLGEPGRLPDPARRQRDVEVTLDPVLGIPRGFAMANQQQRGGRHARRGFSV